MTLLTEYGLLLYSLSNKNNWKHFSAVYKTFARWEKEYLCFCSHKESWQRKIQFRGFSSCWDCCSYTWFSLLTVKCTDSLFYPLYEIFTLFKTRFKERPSLVINYIVICIPARGWTLGHIRKCSLLLSL